MEEELTEIQLVYITRIQEATEAFGNIHKLILGDKIVTPQSVNRALASYGSVNDALLDEYTRKKVVLAGIKTGYEQWYDEKYLVIKKSLTEETPKKAPTIKDIETSLRVAHKVEYYEWQNKLELAEIEVSFYRRKTDSLKKYDNILTTLSNNMRAEMKALTLENRMNSPIRERKVK